MATNSRQVLAVPSGRHEEPAIEVRVEACEHLTVEHLGSGGSATYARCTACGAVFVGRAGRIWSLRAIPG